VPSEKEKMLAGEPYDPSDPDLVAERERARRLTERFNDADANDAERRRELLDELFGSVGERVTVEPPFRCDYGYNVRVGDDFFVNFDCVFLDVCRIEFGDECMLGPGVHVYTATHSTDPVERTSGTEYGTPVTVGDRAWIGGRAVLNPGVEVGDDAVVASSAVVTDDVPRASWSAGTPRRSSGRCETTSALVATRIR
jgi:maltose O-acetyltransferase